MCCVEDVFLTRHFVLMKRVGALIVALMMAVMMNAERMHFDAFYEMVVFYMETDGENNGVDYEELKERLRQYYYVPIDWNKSTRQELEELMFVPDRVIDEMLNYRDWAKRLYSVNELALVKGMSDGLRRLLYYVIVVPEICDERKWSDAFDYTGHYLVARSDFEAERRAGYENGKYQGEPFRQIVKYKTDAGSNFRAGIVMETDAGESWNRRGFDLYRAYGQFSNIGVVERVVAGSMRVNFGNGLVFGSSNFGTRSYQMVNGLNRNNIKSYEGTTEAEMMNGASVKVVPVKGMTISALYGFSPLDANISDGEWKTILTTGYHRTETEIERDNTVGLHTVGGHIDYEGKWFKVGATGYGGFFTVPSVYEYGDKQWAVSTDYSLFGRGVKFSGETSVSQGGGVATTNTLIVTALSDYLFAVNHRYFSTNYTSFWANTYSRGTEVEGEQGVSVSATLPVYYDMNIELYGDVSRNYLYAYEDVTGKPMYYEARVQYNAGFGDDRAFKTYFRFKHQELSAIDEKIRKKVDDQTFLAFAEYKRRFNCGVRISSGAQFNAVRRKMDGWGSPTYGWLVFQDVEWSGGKVVPIEVKGRLAYYDAKDWDNRFYLYEANIAESSYSPTLYGQALRWFVMLKYAAKCGLGLQMKVGQTLFFDREKISSGNDLISKKHKTEFNLLVYYKFKHKRNKK